MVRPSGTGRMTGIVKGVLLAAVVIFLGRALLANWGRMSAYPWEVHWGSLAASILFLIGYYLVSFLLWETIYRGLGVSLPLPVNFGIWFLSQAGKYLPGKVWGALGRIYLAERFGVRKMETGVCLAYEALWNALGGTMIALGTISYWVRDIGISSMGGLLWLAPLPLLLMHPKIMEWMTRRSLRWFGVQAVLPSFPPLMLLRLLSISLLLWILGGAAFYCLIKAVFPVSPALLIPFGGIFAASILIGTFSFLAPAGLGVREGVLILLLSSHMPEAVAVGVAFGTRFWTICVEAVGIAAGWSLLSSFKKKTANPQ